MNSTKPLMIVTTLLGTGLAGCINLTPPATAAQARGLTVNSQSSPQVFVAGPRLQMNHGALELAGSIDKQPGASSTAFSHLDVFFCGNSGEILRVKPVRFTPQSVGHSRLGSRRGYYALKLEPLPEGTTKVEVRAHDGEFTAPHSLTGLNPLTNQPKSQQSP